MERTFPVIICELRKEKGVSQKQAAEDLGISQALLSHYEKGIRECGQDFLMRAADYYKVTCDYLLGRNSSKSGFGEYFITDYPLPDDAKYTDYTLFRAAITICEKLASAELPNGLDYSIYIGIELYRVMFNLVSAGIVPKSWLAVVDADAYINPITQAIVNSITSTILTSNNSDGFPPCDSSDEVPMCIKTMGNIASDFLVKLVAAGTPPIPEKYKK